MSCARSLEGRRYFCIRHPISAILASPQAHPAHRLMLLNLALPIWSACSILNRTRSSCTQATSCIYLRCGLIRPRRMGKSAWQSMCSSKILHEAMLQGGTSMATVTCNHMKMAGETSADWRPDSTDYREKLEDSIWNDWPESYVTKPLQ